MVGVICERKNQLMFDGFYFIQFIGKSKQMNPISPVTAKFKHQYLKENLLCFMDALLIGRKGR